MNLKAAKALGIHTIRKITKHEISLMIIKFWKSTSSIGVGIYDVYPAIRTLQTFIPDIDLSPITQAEKSKL